MESSRRKLCRLAWGGVVLASLAGCGGVGTLTAPAASHHPPAASVVVKATPRAVATPKPTPRATPTPLPKPVPTATPTGPAPLPAPAVPFDLRGQVLVAGAGRAGLVIRVTGAVGAVTPSDTTVSGGRGVYSFFLGGGTYTVTASDGTRTTTRRVTIPFGGQTVDNFNLTL